MKRAALRNTCMASILTGLLAAGGPVLAQGWYFGIEGLNSEADTGVTNLTGTATLDEEDSGIRLILGRKLSENFSIEGLYVDFGEATLTGNTGDTFDLDGFTFAFLTSATLTAESSGWGLGARGDLPLGERFGLFGRAGMLIWDLESNVDGNDDGSDLYYGFGANYMVSPSVSIELAADFYTISESDVDTMSLGVRVAF